MEFVRIEYKAPIAWVFVDRPKALNALSAAVMREIASAFEELAQRADIRCVLLAGGGDRAFVAGADIAEMQAFDERAALAFSALGHRTFDSIADFPVPVIAVVQGFALGGGAELALACDFIVAGEKAVFGQPEIDLGVVPGFSGTQRLARKIGQARAGELLFTGRRIDAQEALRIGLAVHVFPQESLAAEAEKIANQIASKGPLAVQQAKRVLRAGLETDLRRGNELEQWAFSRCFASADQKEGMAAFLEKRKPVFKGE
jgi:enoyl-CoA hydratase